MAENTLEIILQATDNATATISSVKTSLDGVSKSTQDVSKKTEEAGRTIKQQFKEAGAQVRDFRKTVMLGTLALAAIIATTKEAANYNAQAKTTYDKFTTSIKTLSATIGQALAPALEGVTFVINILSDTIEAAIAGFIKLGTFIVAFFANLKSGPVEAYKQAVREMNAATDNFLRKYEETRNRVQDGVTFDKQKQETIDLEKITVRSNKKIREAWESQVSGVQMALSTLSSALDGAAAQNKKFAVAAKVVAIGLAIVNTAVGITNALAVPPPWFGMALAAIVGAAGAIQIATIAATPLAEGGIVTRPTHALIGEAGPEAVIPLTRFGGSLGKTQNIHIEINYPSIRSTDDIDSLTEAISSRLAREADRL